MSSEFYALIFIFCVFVCSCTQITLKTATFKPRNGLNVYFNRAVIISNVVFFAATLVAVMLYRYIQLSTATLLNSASYIFVFILSAVFLKEKINKRKLIGVIFIMAGIAVYAVFDGVL